VESSQAIKHLIAVMVGGALGSGTRFLIGRWLAPWSALFPWGTFSVNVLACFVLGALVGWADHRQPFSGAAQLFWTAGFCGGFSTFSTFSQELFTLVQRGETITGIAYGVASIMVCLMATAAGWYLGHQA
jgi:CrcB protein